MATQAAGGVDRKLTKAEVKDYVRSQTNPSAESQMKAKAAKMALNLMVKAKKGGDD